MVYVFEWIGEDDAFAAYEAAAWAADVRVVAPGIGLARDITEQVGHLAWTRTVSSLIARTSPASDAMVAALAAAGIDGGGTAAVRARAVRGADADTQAIERSVGGELTAAGYDIDLESPDRLLRVLVSEECAYLGWVIARPGGDVGRRRPTDRPFFQPGSMSPRLARALVNFVRVQPSRRVLDPMCGTGGILLEAVRVGGRAIGLDVQDRMVRGTRRNWRSLEAPAGSLAVANGDARALPIGNGSVDAVVFDLPYGRQSPIAGGNLARQALREAYRVGREAVVVADRDLADVLDRTRWQVTKTFERRVHRSLTRHIAHLQREVGES